MFELLQTILRASEAAEGIRFQCRDPVDLPALLYIDGRLVDIQQIGVEQIKEVDHVSHYCAMDVDCSNDARRANTGGPRWIDPRATCRALRIESTAEGTRRPQRADADAVGPRLRVLLHQSGTALRAARAARSPEELVDVEDVRFSNLVA